VRIPKGVGSGINILEGFITAVQYHITAEKIDIIPDCPYLQDESSKNN
jgi:hypothetical protein